MEFLLLGEIKEIHKEESSKSKKKGHTKGLCPRSTQLSARIALHRSQNTAQSGHAEQEPISCSVGGPRLAGENNLRSKSRLAWAGHA